MKQFNLIRKKKKLTLKHFSREEFENRASIIRVHCRLFHCRLCQYFLILDFFFLLSKSKIKPVWSTQTRAKFYETLVNRQSRIGKFDKCQQCRRLFHMFSIISTYSRCLFWVNDFEITVSTVYCQNIIGTNPIFEIVSK